MPNQQNTPASIVLNAEYFSRIAGILVFCLAAALLILSSGERILSDNVEIGDLAANSILIQDAKSFTLLVGNYSRVGLNHPGPAILYVLAAGEWLFHDLTHWVPSPLSGQIIAAALYTAFWMALLFECFRKLFPSFRHAAFGFFCFIYTIALFDQQFLNGLWFPYLYLFPFAVALLCLSRVFEGDTSLLGSLALSSGFLINGHVAFVPILGLMLAGAITCNHIRHGNDSQRILCAHFFKTHKHRLLFALALFASFLLPLAILTMRNFPGPIAAYLNYGQSHHSHALSEAIHFASFYWGGDIPMSLSALVCLLLFMTRSKWPGLNAGIESVILLVLLASIALIYYAKYGVDFLEMAYTGYFYYAAPALLIALLAVLVADTIYGNWMKIPLIILCCFLVTGTFLQATRNPGIIMQYLQRDAVDAISRALLRVKPENGRVVLDIDRNAGWARSWSYLLGVSAQAKRTKPDLFCINQNWHIAFTRHAQCTAEELSSPTRFLVRNTSSQHSATASFSAGGLSFFAEPHP